MCFVSRQQLWRDSSPIGFGGPEDTDAVTSGLDNFCAAVKDTPCAENIQKDYQQCQQVYWKKTDRTMNSIPDC